MGRQLFREKSMKTISSPEELNDYIHVPNPCTWIILIAVILILTGIGVWGIFGHLDTKTETIGIARDGKVTCYISEMKVQNVKKGTSVFIEGKEYQIETVSNVPIELAEEQLLALGTQYVGEKFYMATVKTKLGDGIYKVELITDRVAPVSFVWN